MIIMHKMVTETGNGSQLPMLALQLRKKCDRGIEDTQQPSHDGVWLYTNNQAKDKIIILPKHLIDACVT